MFNLRKKIRKFNSAMKLINANYFFSIENFFKTFFYWKMQIASKDFLSTKEGMIDDCNNE